MRILGVDPGLANTGYGVIDHDGSSSRLVACGTIVTSKDDPVAMRLRAIHDGLAAVIAEHAPAEAAMEQLFFCTNVKTAIAVAQARGVAILANSVAGLPLSEYTPLEVKLAVAGSGKADKGQVARMVQAILGGGITLADSHSADAIAVAICHAHSMKFRQLTGLPEGVLTLRRRRSSRRR